MLNFNCELYRVLFYCYFGYSNMLSGINCFAISQVDGIVVVILKLLKLSDLSSHSCVEIY